MRLYTRPQTLSSYSHVTVSFSSQQVLREVKVLAHLSHSNVVGYHAAWLEYVTTDNAGCALPSELLLYIIFLCCFIREIR